MNAGGNKPPLPTTRAGTVIHVGDIFWVDYPAPRGRHMSVVLAVQGDYLAVVYGQSQAGKGMHHRIQPRTAEAIPFGPCIVNDTHFRVDCAVVVHRTYFDTYIGRSVVVTQTELTKVFQGAAALGLKAWIGPPPPSPP